MAEQRKKKKPASLSTAISRRAKEIRERNQRLSTEDDSEEKLARYREVAEALSAYLEDLEEVSVPPDKWVISESMFFEDSIIYEARLVIERIDDDGKIYDKRAVWAKNLELVHLRDKVRRYRWSAKYNEQYMKFDTFVAAATFAETGLA